jgi:hypothetical protein
MSHPAIPKALYDTLKEAGVVSFELNFSGGSDEGYLSVTCNEGYEDEIEEWANEAFDYSGAGDGQDYGDDYTYNLETGKVTHQSWYMEPTYNDPTDNDIEVEDDTV